MGQFSLSFNPLLFGTVPTAFVAALTTLHCGFYLMGTSVGQDRPLPFIFADMQFVLDPLGRYLAWNTQRSLQPCPVYAGQPTGRPATGGAFTGVACADSTTIPTHTLSLRNRQLSGSVPAVLRDLRSFTTIDLSYNSLQGTLPAGWSSPLPGAPYPSGGGAFGFDGIVTLSLAQNNLTGPLPPGLGLALQDPTGTNNLFLDDNLVRLRLPAWREK